jgi:hypothetical protein
MVFRQLGQWTRLAAILAFLLGGFVLGSATHAQSLEWPTATVTGIADAGVLEVAFDDGRLELVRLLGLEANTESLRTCVIDRTASLVAQRVALELDPGLPERDESGLLQARVWLEDGRTLSDILVVECGTPTPPGFDPHRFVGQGDRYNCPAFVSQADAQAVLRADPSDPNRLDADRDGIACETNPAPRDRVPVPRT